jgi:hypothetical protein
MTIAALRPPLHAPRFRHARRQSGLRVEVIS